MQRIPVIFRDGDDVIQIQKVRLSYAELKRHGEIWKSRDGQAWVISEFERDRAKKLSSIVMLPLPN